MKARSLRKQLIISLCIGLAILCVVGNFAIFSYIKKLDLQEFDKDLINQAHTLVALTRLKKPAYDFHEYLPTEKSTYYQLWTKDRKFLARSLSLEEHELPIIEVPPGQIEIRDIPLPDGKTARMAVLSFFPKMDDDQGPPDSDLAKLNNQIHIAFAKSREDLDHIVSLELSFSLLIGGLLIASAALVVFFLVNRSFQTIGDFSDQIQSIEPWSISQRLRKDNLPAEFIPFCDQFNALLDRLEASFKREKRFNANIAHELRTPIAELRLLNEVAIQEIDGLTQIQSSRPYFEDALQLTTRMERVVEVLTLLNQLETEQIQPAIETFSMDTVIRDGWKSHIREAEEKKVSCSFQIPKSIPIQSDRALMSGIIDNLISNAIAHSPQGSEIVCRLNSEDPFCRFEVINPSEDLSPKELSLLSEPFWQKDPSRTSTTHVGLGLTLVEAYCKILSITLTMQLEAKNLLHTQLSIPNLSRDGKTQAGNRSLPHVSTIVKGTSTLIPFLLSGLLILFPGCTNPSVDYSPTIDGIERTTGFRSGLKDTPYSAKIPEGISLQDGVTVEEAIALALWNNAAFQETLSGLGLSQAAVIQANMLTNPTFWILFPVGPKQLEFLARFPLEALWLRPQRVAAAQGSLDQAANQLVQHGLTVVRDVKVLSADLLLAENRLRLALHQKTVLQQISRVNETRLRAGAISELEAASSRIDVLVVDDRIQQFKHEIAQARERFRVLLGFGLRDFPVTLIAPSTLPSTDRRVEEILNDALATRPDLRATELAIEAAGIRAGLARKDIFMVSGLFDLNAFGGQNFNAGPGLRFTLPIFNQNEGQIALAEAGFDQALRRYVTVRDQIVLEVRQTHTRWLQTVESLDAWRQQILPVHHTAMTQAQKALEAGQVTPLVPLTAQRNWNEARVREMELLAENRRAVAELERAIGHALDVKPQPSHSPQTKSS